MVLPDRSQFESQSAYTHTALHELGHATGHPNRRNRPTLVKHGGFGSETYAREELRAEIAAIMTGASNSASGTSRGTAPRTSVPGSRRWRTTRRRSAPQPSMRSGSRTG